MKMKWIHSAQFWKLQSLQILKKWPDGKPCKILIREIWNFAASKPGEGNQISTQTHEYCVTGLVSEWAHIDPAYEIVGSKKINDGSIARGHVYKKVLS